MTRLIYGRYEVLEEIGSSALGTTYAVRHPLLGMTLSVTALLPTLTDQPDRFACVRSAVRQASRLRHEHIAPVLDFAWDAGRYHVAEAMVDAAPLDQVLRETGPLPPAEALHVARQVADGLGHAHEHGVVHGGLNPATVRLQRGRPPHATVCGFAIAPLAPPLGRYVAPEQLDGRGAEARTDVFALGLLLFEMLEGRPLFQGSQDDIRDVLLRQGEPVLPRFSTTMPVGLSGLVARAICWLPANRHRSMLELRDGIDASLRRLGPRSIETRVRVAVDAQVRRHAGVLVDEAVSDEVDRDPPRNRLKRAEADHYY
jgi:serine/threonine protein kinase